MKSGWVTKKLGEVCETADRGMNSDGWQKRLHYRFALCPAPESRHTLALKSGFGARSASEVVTERFLQTIGVDLFGGAT